VISRGLSSPEFFAIQAVFLTVLAITDIPAGIFADIFDRRAVLVFASIVRGLGGTVLMFAYDYNAFLAAFVLIAIGNSFFSGTDIAILYESNSVRPKGPRSPVEILGLRFMFMQTSGAISMVVGAAVATYSLEVAIVLNCIGAWLPLLQSLRLSPSPYPKGVGRRSETLRKAVVHPALRSSSSQVLLFLICIFSAAPFAAFYVYQSLWSSFGLPLYSYGIIAAGYGLCGAFAGRLAHPLEKRIGSRGIIIVITVAPVVAFACAGSSILVFALIGGVFLELCRGLTQSVLVARFNESFPEDVRATINSVSSFGTRMLAAALNTAVAGLLMSVSVSGVLHVAAAFYAAVMVMAVAALLLKPDLFEPTPISVVQQ
jgi:MFS family permease